MESKGIDPFDYRGGKSMKKRIIAAAMAVLCAFSMVACGTQTQPTTSEPATEEVAETTEETTEEAPAAESTEAGKTYKIAVVKQMDHIALDEIADNITAELDVIAKEKGVTITYEVYSGQNDQSTLKQICDQAVADQVDAIIPIATLASQVAVVSAEDSKTPVIYASVSDPKSADLTGFDFVTGTSDALNTELIMDMILAQNPDCKKIGFLYSLSEINSATPIADAKKYCDAKGIEYVEQTANTNDEVVAAAAALVASDVDAVFTPTDNVIMAAEMAIYQSFIDAGIPHYTGADEFVIQGAFATCGVNYPHLGVQTADIAYEAITGDIASMDDFYLVDGGIIVVNTETAAAINAEYSMFKDMGELNEVKTSETRE